MKSMCSISASSSSTILFSIGRFCLVVAQAHAPRRSENCANREAGTIDGEMHSKKGANLLLSVVVKQHARCRSRMACLGGFLAGDMTILCSASPTLRRTRQGVIERSASSPLWTLEERWSPRARACYPGGWPTRHAFASTSSNPWSACEDEPWSASGSSCVFISQSTCLGSPGRIASRSERGARQPQIRSTWETKRVRHREVQAADMRSIRCVLGQAWGHENPSVSTAPRRTCPLLQIPRCSGNALACEPGKHAAGACCQKSVHILLRGRCGPARPSTIRSLALHS